MRRSIITIVFSIVALASANAADAKLFPFMSVVVQEQSIVASLPVDRRWLVEVAPFESRLSTLGETFTLHVGSSLRLIERHSNYWITAQLSPSPGLQVESTFDARSFGGVVTRKTYFIPAQ